MKTKLFLTTAAVGALSLASAMADVTSVNVVGFVNVVLPTGFSLLSNPLKATNDTVQTIFGNNLPDGTVIFKWDAVHQTWGTMVTYDTTVYGGWDDGSVTIAGGEGFFIQLPTRYTNTFVGEVRQATSGPLNTPIANGFSFVGSQVPQAGLISALSYTPHADAVNGEQEVVFQFTPGAGWGAMSTFDMNVYGGWDAEPTLGIAEGIAIQRTAAGNWTSTFTVQ